MGTYSSDEGEIHDGIMGTGKATTSPRVRDSGVDRQSRHRGKYSVSPTRSIGSRHSVERDTTSRGSKRYRDDDHYARGYDPRRFKVHYEDRPDDRHRRHGSYEDLDSVRGGPARLPYDDEPRSYGRRSRSRSRSPYRAPRHADHRDRDRYGHHRDDRRGGRTEVPVRTRDRANGHPTQQDRSSRQQSVSNGGVKPVPTDAYVHDAKTVKGSSEKQDDTVINGNDSKAEQENAQPEREPVVDAEPLDEAALIEERRKRRQAVLAKHKAGPTPLMAQALGLGDKSTPDTSARSETEDAQSTRDATPEVSTPGTPKEIQDPTAFNEQELSKGNAVKATAEDDGPSAADYDPTMDMKEDRYRDDKRHHHDQHSEVGSSAYNEIKHTTEQDVLIPAAGAAEIALSVDDEFDMFAEGDDDEVFAEKKPAPPKSTQKTDDSSAVAVPILHQGTVLNTGMLDNWDDPEGYYKVILGELLNNRYHVQANLGKGMFSGVVRATDITTKKLVAIKLIRANETMKKAGMKEIEILQKLMDADPEDKKHLIRLERYFEHKGHLCMVFEHLSINLREVLKKFGRDVGINLRAVRIYAQQMFLGLSLMRKCNVLHADLKPDNILVNENRSMLKICDLGSASDASDNEITPYLVSRFYRAPEIILGMPYDFAIDVWSVGCTLYELYTGKILFVGRSNNQMLRAMMETRGRFTTKMLKKSEFAYLHFDEHANFMSVEPDKLTGKDTIKTMSFVKPTRDLRTRLLGNSKGLPEEEVKELNLFVDLLDKCLALNPEKRITPAEALKHPFINRAARV